MNELTHLDLFSGIGGFALAAEWAGFETIGFSEIEPFACRVLAKHWPNVKNYGDIRTLPSGTIRDVRLITGGYPCQPFSSAGKRQGERDDRHLWPAMRDIIEAIRPTWVVAENVAGHISMGLDQVLANLESLNYAVQPIVIPACAVGAWHRRDRVWICAHSMRSAGSPEFEKQQSQRSEKSWGICQTSPYNDGPLLSQQADEICARRNTADVSSEDAPYAGTIAEERLRKREEKALARARNNGEVCSDSRGQRQSRPRDDQQSMRPASAEDGQANSSITNGRGIAESRLGRMANGLPSSMDDHSGWAALTSIPPTNKSEGRAGRVHRLKALGNAIVPQVVHQILKGIAQIERGEITA